MLNSPSPSRASLVRHSLYKVNRTGDKQHPCLTPLPICTLLVSPRSSRTLTCCSMYNLLIKKQHYSIQISHTFNNHYIVLFCTKIIRVTFFKKNFMCLVCVWSCTQKRLFLPSVTYKIHPLSKAGYT